MTRAWPTRSRITAAVIATAVQAALLLILWFGLRVATAPASSSESTTFALRPPPPSPAVRSISTHRPSTRRSGAAAPVALKAVATAVVAPPPIVTPSTPPPIVAAAEAGPGTAPAIGNAERPGVGTGTGGEGTGTGNGGHGSGTGGDRWTPPRLVKGLRRGDYPRAAAEAEVQGVVTVRYRVGTDGRVTDCRLVASSGSAILDAATCPLAELRFRYRPAKDEDGRPIVVFVTRENEWIIDDPSPGR